MRARRSCATAATSSAFTIARPAFSGLGCGFLFNYIFRLGFLDGREGFLYLYFECCWYRMLVDAKIYEHEVMNAPLEELKALD